MAEPSGWNPVAPQAYSAPYAVPPAAPGAPVSSDPFTPVPAAPLATQARGHNPIGAVVLIVIGMLLLLHTLGVFEEEWVSRAWPVILIGVGAWLLYRRTRDTTGTTNGDGGRRGGF